jgi:hypothetical protein
MTVEFVTKPTRRSVLGLHGFPVERGTLTTGDYSFAAGEHLLSIEAKFLPVVFAPTPEAGARLVERWIYWTARAAIETARRISPLSSTFRALEIDAKLAGEFTEKQDVTCNISPAVITVEQLREIQDRRLAAMKANEKADNGTMSL